MPVATKPEDLPAAVCFHLDFQQNGLQVSCTLLPRREGHPYRIEGGTPQFANRDEFKAKVVDVGMSPAVAEDPGRSFNATARQLQKLGFSVQVEQKAA
jgi:hypothetical protein